jgi:hypothetical protein
LVNRSSSIASSAVIVGAINRIGPSASLRSGWRACGNHLTQSQSSRRSVLVQTAIRRLSGACREASCATIARASDRDRSSSPGR